MNGIDILDERICKAIKTLKNLYYQSPSPYDNTQLPSYEDWVNAYDEAERFLKDCDIDEAIRQSNEGLDFDKIADEMEQDLKESEGGEHYVQRLDVLTVILIYIKQQVFFP